MPAEIPDSHLGAWRALLNAHAALIERIEAALAEADLPPLAWYDVLWALRQAPGRRLRMGELARAVTISRGGLTKLVDRLEAAGLLERRACADDRRGYHAVSTADGQAMLRRMWPIYAGVLDDAFVGVLGTREAKAVAAALKKVSGACVTR